MDELFEQARLSLPHVYWIGGPGCSGKTTTTRLLGSQFGLQVFHVDDELANWALDPNLRPPQWRDIDFLGKQGRPLFHLPAAEVAAYVIHDWQAPLFRETLRRLLSLPRDCKVIVEGVFLPETLLQVTTPDRIAVMTADRAFHHQYFAHRTEWIAAYSDKAAAYNTVLDALDEMNRQWISQAAQYNLHLFTIQSPQEIRDVAAVLAEQFALVSTTQK